MVRVHVTLLLDNLDIYDFCTFQVLNGPRVRPLFFTSLFSTGTRVVLQMGHMSFLHWTMCHIFIGPRGRFVFDHVSRCCPSMFCFLIRPHGLTASFHVLDFFSPRAMPWLFHVSSTGSSMCHIFIWSCGLPRFYHMPNNQFVIKVIQDHHCCIDWLHNYSTMSA